MTDNQFPILADGLFDGGLAADVAPKDLRAAVNVLSAAGRPGSEAELATMAARVRQFSAEINAAAKAPHQAAISQVHYPTTAFVDARRPYDMHMSDDTIRSNPMFATRITRKAMTIVAITLLAAGTAAAAAGGALPMFEKDDTNVVVHEPVEAQVIDDFSHQSDNQQSSDDSKPVTQAATVIAVLNADEASSNTADFFGKCTAWGNGAAKDATNPAFADLQAAADASTLTIDEFCATVEKPGNSDDKNNTGTDNKPADDKPAVTTQPPDAADDQPADDSGDDDPNADDPEVTTPAATPGTGTGNGNGNGNSGHGNSGHGNGNSGHD